MSVSNASSSIIIICVYTGAWSTSEWLPLFMRRGAPRPMGFARRPIVSPADVE